MQHAQFPQVPVKVGDVGFKISVNLPQQPVGVQQEQQRQMIEQQLQTTREQMQNMARQLMDALAKQLKE